MFLGLRLAVGILLVTLINGCVDPKYSQLRQNKSLQLLTCFKQGINNDCIRQSGTPYARCMLDAVSRQPTCCAPSSIVIQLLTSRADGIVKPAQIGGFEKEATLVANSDRQFDDPLFAVANRDRTSYVDLCHVSPIVFGETYLVDNSASFSGTASVALIRDKFCNVLVNTAAPGQAAGLMKGLGIARLSTTQIHYVLITSTYLPLMGNVHLFPASIVYAERMIINQLNMSSNALATRPTMNLCSNIQLVRTPGPTPHSMSVIVHNVQHLGILAITGVLFAEETSAILTWDRRERQNSQRRVICIADYVMPAFGDVWRVTEQMKRDNRC